MDYIDLFNTLKNEGFGEDLALLTTVATAAKLVLTPTQSEMQKKGAFKKRIEKVVAQTLWQHPKHIDNVLKIQDVLYDYEVLKSLDGLGGAKSKTILELLKEKGQHNVKTEC